MNSIPIRRATTFSNSSISTRSVSTRVTSVECRSIYDVTELCTAVKPWLLQTLLRMGTTSVLYFDPDIEIFAPLDDVGELAREHTIVRTPHTTEPIPRDNLRLNETDILAAGIYNLGFIAVGSAVQISSHGGRTDFAANVLLTTRECALLISAGSIWCRVCFLITSCAILHATSPTGICTAGTCLDRRSLRGQRKTAAILSLQRLRSR